MPALGMILGGNYKIGLFCWEVGDTILNLKISLDVKVLEKKTSKMIFDVATKEIVYGVLNVLYPFTAHMISIIKAYKVVKRCLTSRIIVS